MTRHVNDYPALFRRHAACPLGSVVHEERGAYCASCGVSWVLVRRDGEPVAFRLVVPTLVGVA